MPEPTAPQASDAPATAKPDAPASNAPPVSNMEDVYGEFDAIESKDTGQQAAPAKEMARQAPKQDTTQEQSSAASATTKPTEDGGKTENPTASDAGKPAEQKPVKAAELRNAYENLKREHHKLKADFEKAKTASQDETRVKQLQELLDNERKARAEIEQELKMTAYERSQEFKDKFQKPYMDAYKMGRQKAASLKVQEVKNDVDEVVRPGRQGTEADFDTIMRIDDDDTAAEKAAELFGPVKAQAVLYYRERVQELHNSSRSAIEDYRNNAATREKEMIEARTRQEQQQAEMAKANAETFRKLVDEGIKARPEFFTPAEGDTEAAEVVKRGQAVADSLFSGINPKTGRPYTPDGLVKFHAFVRNAVAAHGHILHKLKAAEVKLAEMESDLAEYKQSGSSKDSGRAGEPKKGDGLPGDEEFDEVESRSGHRW